MSSITRRPHSYESKTPGDDIMGRQKKRICGMGGLLAAALVMILAGSEAEPAPVYGGTPEKKVDALSYHMNLKLNARKDRLYETVTMKVKNNTGKTVTTKEAVALIRSYDNSRAMNEIIRFYIR
jgi:hypothetical protein